VPFNRPTLQDLITRIGSDIESRLPGVDAKLRRQVLSVIGRSLAGATHGLHGHLDWLALQILPDTADDALLDRHGVIWDVPRKQAAAATGDLTFTGVTGAVIPAATLVQRSDGAEFVTNVDATLAAGTISTAVTALAAGSDGNTEAASTLTLVNPIAGCNNAATVGASGIEGGADLESDDALRGRIIARIQAPPHGGSVDDYEMWALAVAGVTRAWVSPGLLGSGTVGVYIVCDGQEGSIIPDAGTVLAAQVYIDARRPVTAQPTVFAPTATPVNFTIAVTPDTVAVRTAVEAELVDLLRREAEPGGPVLLSHIREAISLAVGETDHVLTIPAADVLMASGELAILGTITWT